MNILQTYYDDCIHEHGLDVSGRYLNSVINWLSIAYSCLTLKKNNPKSPLFFYGDSDIVHILRDLFKLPYDEYKIFDRHILEGNKYYCLPKIITYSLQNAPFIHIDTDIFVSKPFPQYWDRSDLIAQHQEHDSTFYKLVYDYLKESKVKLLDIQKVCIDGSYINSIQKRVDEIFERETEVLDSIHDWKIYEAPKDKSEENKRKAEDAYNREIANQLGGLCLDRMLIYPESSKSGIEACDVLLPDGIFIHVKHVSSSAPASHLLAQSLVSTSLLRNDEYSQDKLREMIDGIGEDTDKYDVRPRQVVIVMAKDDKLLTAESLFTFTKINLVRHDQNLANLDVKLNIVPVIRRK